MGTLDLFRMRPGKKLRVPFRDRLQHLLHMHDTPERTAAAFALGVFFGFSPFLGLHTILGLVFAFGLNLNRVAVLIGVYSNLPWILPPYYAAVTLAGAAVLGAEVPPELMARIREGSWTDLRALGLVLRPLAMSFVAGSLAGATGLALVAYRLSLAAIVAHRRHLAKRHEHEHSQHTDMR
jgi:uncharacterized protein (DUF2062 family)